LSSSTYWTIWQGNLSELLNLRSRILTKVDVKFLMYLWKAWLISIFHIYLPQVTLGCLHTGIGCQLTIKQGVRPRSRKPVPFHLQTDVSFFVTPSSIST
jgi:hypothetical protein